MLLFRVDKNVETVGNPSQLKNIKCNVVLFCYEMLNNETKITLWWFAIRLTNSPMMRNVILVNINFSSAPSLFLFHSRFDSVWSQVMIDFCALIVFFVFVPKRKSAKSSNDWASTHGFARTVTVNWALGRAVTPII